MSGFHDSEATVGSEVVALLVPTACGAAALLDEAPGVLAGWLDPGFGLLAIGTPGEPTDVGV